MRFHPSAPGSCRASEQAPAAYYESESANYGVFGFMFAPCRSDWYSVCSARLAQRSAIESSMARISGFVVADIASRQCDAFCLQGVRMGQASLEEITYPLRVQMRLGSELVPRQ